MLVSRPLLSAIPIALMLGQMGCAAQSCPPAAAPDHQHPSAPPPPPPAPPPAEPVVVLPPPASTDVGPSALRQIPALPRPSPNAEVRQQVGVTLIGITYSSPGKKGREIWGGLLPFGEKWRVGANAPTRISFDNEVTIGGKKIPAGSYSVFAIPNAEKLTVILNKDPEGKGVREHDPKLDVARVDVPFEDAPVRERMAFLFENTKDDRTELVLDWAGRRAAVPITVDTAAHVGESIDATVENAWRPLFNAGRYTLDTKKDAKAALALLEQSIGVKATWWNTWFSAKALKELGRVPEARARAAKAAELGKGDDVYDNFYADEIKKALAEWPAN